jgi:hypothetical protein
MIRPSQKESKDLNPNDPPLLQEVGSRFLGKVRRRQRRDDILMQNIMC